jgi:subtilisin family serine protease
MAVKEAVEAGVLTVFSAGNESTDTPHFPSDYADSSDESLGHGVISVAATDNGDHRASYSNYSPRVSVCAPGGDGLPIDERDILCAVFDGTFAYAAGTSIAAPHVAAIAALLLSVDSQLSPSQLKEVLLGTATDIRSQNPMFQQTLGAGRVDALTAVNRIEGGPGDAGGSGDGGPADGHEESPNGSTPAVAASTTIPIADINLILTMLRATQLELLSRTGWSLASAELQKDNQTTAFDLLSEM